MREQIFNALYAKMAQDPSLFFLTADVGINLVERIADTYPKRFINVGIAEQNMIGVAAGLANCGHRPVCYTISIFCIERCLEQIRDEVALHKYPVIILGSTVGYDNNTLGATHQMVDDWGCLRAVNGLEVHCPTSLAYAKAVFDDLYERRAAAYVRIPKGSFPRPDSPDPIVHLPGAESSVLLCSYGGPAQACLQAQQRDPRLSVMVFNKLRPVDDQFVAEQLSRYERVIVVEDHFAETGLYSTICQVVAGNRLALALESRAPKEYYFDVGNSQEYFWKKFGGDADSLAQVLSAPVAAR